MTLALKRISFLWTAAHTYAATSPVLAQRYILQLRDIACLMNVDLEDLVQLRFCQFCSAFCIPGVSASVSIKKRRFSPDSEQCTGILVTRCITCGKDSSIPVGSIEPHLQITLTPEVKIGHEGELTPELIHDHGHSKATNKKISKTIDKRAQMRRLAEQSNVAPLKMTPHAASASFATSLFFQNQCEDQNAAKLLSIPRVLQRSSITARDSAFKIPTTPARTALNIHTSPASSTNNIPPTPANSSGSLSAFSSSARTLLNPSPQLLQTPSQLTESSDDLLSLKSSSSSARRNKRKKSLQSGLTESPVGSSQGLYDLINSFK